MSEVKKVKSYRPVGPIGSIPRLGGVDAVALLIFLSRAAGAGFVAPNFGLVPYNRLYFAVFLSGRGCALVWSGESQRRGPPRRAPLLQTLRCLLRNDLQVE